MADPKHEPVACVVKGDGWGEELMFSLSEAAERAQKLSEYFRLTIEPLYPASTIEALTAQLDALKEENERLKAIRWVKALEWRDNEAISATGHYRAQRLGDKWEPIHNGHYMLPRVHGVVKAFDTVEEAKAVAQADYETRIMSALTGPQPQLPESVESVEGGE